MRPISIIAIFLFTVFFIEAHAQAPVEGNLLMPRYAPSAATNGQWIYVYGGAPHGGRNGKDFMQQGLHASIERINPNSLTSEYFSSGLHRRANHVSVFTNDRMISCGGRSQVGLERPKMKSCEYLEMSTGLFRELPALPLELRSIGMAEVEGNLYVVGGLIGGNDYSSATYKLASGSTGWEQLEDLPVSKEGPIVAIGNKIYAIGGYNGKTLNTVLVYDTGTGTWSRQKELPYGLSAFSVVTDGTFIYIFGDYQKMDTIHRYDPATGVLYLLDKKMTPRRHTAAVVVGDRAFVIGGNQTSSGKALTIIEAFDLAALRSGGRKLTKD